MTQIWKYPLDVTNPNRVSMPKGAEILCVQIQFDIPTLWAKVQQENERITRIFWIFGTGHTVPEHLELLYISTFQLTGGALIFHVFEEI